MTPTDFWDYAVAVYDRPGVAPDLLALQDQFQTDVNMILFCLWLGQHRQDIAPILAEALTISETWRMSIAPLRTARRALKAQLERRPDLVELRERIKACEREAERRQIGDLAALVTHTAVTAADARNCARHNLEQYVSAANIASALLGRAEVLRILDAAFAA